MNIYIHAYIYILICTYTHMTYEGFEATEPYFNVCKKGTWAPYIRIYAHVCMNVHRNMYIYIMIYWWIYMHTYDTRRAWSDRALLQRAARRAHELLVFVYIYIYIQIYIHIYTHKDICIFIYLFIIHTYDIHRTWSDRALLQRPARRAHELRRRRRRGGGRKQWQSLTSRRGGGWVEGGVRKMIFVCEKQLHWWGIPQVYSLLGVEWFFHSQMWTADLVV